MRFSASTPMTTEKCLAIFFTSQHPAADNWNVLETFIFMLFDFQTAHPTLSSPSHGLIVLFIRLFPFAFAAAEP